MEFQDTMRQAIRTRYHGCTNTKGSRISAAYAGGRIYLSYDHGLNLSGNHKAAAVELATRLGWDNTRLGGWFNGDCFWVGCDGEYRDFTTHILGTCNA